MDYYLLCLQFCPPPDYPAGIGEAGEGDHDEDNNADLIFDQLECSIIIFKNMENKEAYVHICSLGLECHWGQ